MIDNPGILKLLEDQRDNLFQKLTETSISKLYREQYADIKAGRVFVFDNGERQTLSDLKKYSKDNSYDDAYREKLAEYLSLDNDAICVHFQHECGTMFQRILSTEKQDEIQALFIEYDYYYHYNSHIFCYAKQDYPIIEVPRYLLDELDDTKQILSLENGINFEPAWRDCEAFGDLDYLDISFEMENLFRLHSRVLLHKALDKLNIAGKMNFLRNRPFSFYINEHDTEVMMLYRLM